MTSSSEGHGNSSIRMLKREERGESSEEFLADWFTPTFTLDGMIHICAVPGEGLEGPKVNSHVSLLLIADDGLPLLS